jgi:hypothetical protein
MPHPPAPAFMQPEATVLRGVGCKGWHAGQGPRGAVDPCILWVPILKQWRHAGVMKRAKAQGVWEVFFRLGRGPQVLSWALSLAGCQCAICQAPPEEPTGARPMFLNPGRSFQLQFADHQNTSGQAPRQPLFPLTAASSPDSPDIRITKRHTIHILLSSLSQRDLRHPSPEVSLSDLSLPHRLFLLALVASTRHSAYPPKRL